MVPRESAPAGRRMQGRRGASSALASGRCMPRRISLSEKMIAARQAALVRRQEAALRQEFEAVLGPIDAAELRSAAQAVSGLPRQELLRRIEVLASSLRERISGWAGAGGLLAQVHGQVEPLLCGAALDSLRHLRDSEEKVPR